VRVQLKIDKTAQPYPNIPNIITYFGLRCGGFLYKSTQSRRRQIPRTAKAGQFCPGFRKGYCLAVRGSLTSDGRPPLDASGLKLQERLTLIEQSLERLNKKGGCHNH
jgi:hypothetical protein